MALIASLLVFTLPETINVPLPDTVEEAEMLSKKKKPKEVAWYGLKLAIELNFLHWFTFSS